MVPPCPTDAEIVRVWDQDMPVATRESLEQGEDPYSYSRIMPDTDNTCADGWKYVGIEEHGKSGRVIITTSALFHFERGDWRLIEFGEGFGELNPVICSDRVPAAARPEWFTC